VHKYATQTASRGGEWRGGETGEKYLVKLPGASKEILGGKTKEAQPKGGKSCSGLGLMSGKLNWSKDPLDFG